MYRDDILTSKTQNELEEVCKNAELSMRSDMEYMIMTAVREAYNKGLEDGKELVDNYTDVYLMALKYGIVE